MADKGKTLAELKVRPGDKVRCVYGAVHAQTGKEYIVNANGGVGNEPGSFFTVSLFILISRAQHHDAASSAKITGIKPTQGGAEVQSETHDFGGHQPADEDAPRRISEDRTVPVFVREGYDGLFNVLCRALHQAQDGKGKERHAQPDQRFEDQPIIQIGRMVGMGFQNGQAIKKMVEAQGMLSRGEFNAAEREVLGAINYLAAVAIEINRRATAAI